MGEMGRNIKLEECFRTRKTELCNDLVILGLKSQVSEKETRIPFAIKTGRNRGF